MKSFYSVRLYELLRSDLFKDELYYFEYSLDFLHQFFSCEEKYKLYSNFKARVLQIAIDEINAKSDIHIQEALEIKTGRKVTSIKFCVRFNYDVDKKRNPIKYLKYENN